ncbi:MAG: protein translocase subunit SecDF [Bacteroidales bacterium]
MQNKGAIKILAILVALACIYQLSFTWATKHQEKKARTYSAKMVELEQTLPSFSDVPALERAFYLDSLGRVKERFYIDSITAEKVFFGFTYKEVKEREINLGLDLKGGMNVMLEVSLPELISSLAGSNSTNPDFIEAIELAKKNITPARSDFINLFGEAWEQLFPGKRMSLIFGTYEMRDRIKPETSNNEILKVIREESESAISNSFNVLRNRIRRFGVTQPNIQKIGSTGRILVELPGVKEPARVRKLLQGTASLEFWETYENSEIYPYLTEVNTLVKEIESAALESAQELKESVTEEPAATPQEREAKEATAEKEALLEEIQKSDSLSVDDALLAQANPFFSLLSPNVVQGQLGSGPVVGRAHYRDTLKIGSWLRDPKVISLLPADLKLMWGVKPIDEGGIYFELVAIKAATRDGKAPLDGGVITDAGKSFASTSGMPEVNMAMNAEGARTWATMTANNIGKSIAIVLDGLVYSYPRVNSEITGGRSQISGNFTVSEADDLANVLKSGKLPAPARIIQEAVVGPSLGEESINAGLISFVIAFLLVLLYMIFFYSGAGVVANISLLTNVLFLLGTLVSFGAVLTLPGIAGIVLTLGMAVDANVIIYERIKEEIASGKGLRLAVADGYKNAYSAIIDGNLTTIITGIVLAIFGSGPVQGFATTLVIGIITSLVTSIFITRLLFEARLNKNKNITFSNRLTQNFLKNTNINFFSYRRYAYIFSASMMLIGLGFIFFKGFTYGVDFSGGRTYVVRFDTEVAAEDVRVALFNEFEESVEVKQFGGASQMKVTTKYLIDNNSEESDAVVDNKIYNALKGLFAHEISLEAFLSTAENPNGIVSSEKVGPTIADNLKRDSFIAVAIALLAIFAYIAARFRNWAWGSGGVVALLHDALFTMSFFAIFSGVLPFSLDVDQSFIAAILTIIGYSINDTVVVFDRIREYRGLYPKRDLRENINFAINSTLSRTANTSMTTSIVLIAIAIFGGEVIRGFSIALLIGVIVGTYSSVFIASPLAYDIQAKQKPAKGGKK